MKPSIYCQTFQVASKDCSKDQTIKLPHLISYMQEAAWTNATALGYSSVDLLKKGTTWVMNRMRINIQTIPRHQESITVETWPAGMDKYFTKRDFKVWSAEKELLVEAASNWLVMDIHTRKLIPIPEYIKAAGFVVDRGNVKAIEGKIKYDQEQTTHVKPIEISWFDMDINDHVNNTKYYQWVLDSLGGKFLDHHQLTSLDILFKLECKYSDALVSKTYFDEKENAWLHTLDHAHTQQTHVMAKSRFQPKGIES